MTIELNQWRDDPCGVAKAMASEDLKAASRLKGELSMAIHRAGHPDIDEWLAERRREAALIDAESADYVGFYGQIMDPYGVRDLPEELQCSGWNYFARRPGSEIWVWDGDLPATAVKRLEERARNGHFDKSNGEIPF